MAKRCSTTWVLAHIQPNSIASLARTTYSAASIAGPHHPILVTYSSEGISRSGSTSSNNGQTTLSLLTTGPPPHLSTEKILSKMRAQMAIDRAGQASGPRDEMHSKHCMENLPAFHDLKEWDICLTKTHNMLGHGAWGTSSLNPGKLFPTMKPSRESSACASPPH
jgi:hypothetical protein